MSAVAERDLTALRHESERHRKQTRRPSCSHAVSTFSENPEPHLIPGPFLNKQARSTEVIERA
jgi:hypothetical protein